MNVYVTWDDVDCCIHCGWPGARHSPVALDELSNCPLKANRAALARITAYVEACITAMEAAAE